ncbi:hypothetical protein A3A48_00700 [Candidatus Curtissbacteria bacterium RIFCSPLOWO2_01_FULL_37_9]|uniref:Uncharacterized protein n=1 Tax=Candidatus Curtissbacteria bacterium RIFCSPLOWO2_01_FULL_37_9 TaxID=1797724 RepID=A0A1F5GUR5_9BACT|nr:MAG: hypothetical protein A3A48_00700 [Candidatus Curtissbacteria bacterium RIFCSPLOWO2_01_FULL_37_9]
MVQEQIRPYRQEVLSDAERVNQYFAQLLRDNRVNYNSYYASNEHRSSWMQWHRLSKSWFHHALTISAQTRQRRKTQYKFTDNELSIYDPHPLKVAFLIDPSKDISELKDKSPKALIRLARKAPSAVLAERLREH